MADKGKKIELTQGKYALVDDEDFEELNQYKWFAFKHRYTFYACRKANVNGKKYNLVMHRAILGLEYGDTKQSDHTNHNGLDNRKSNLRICTVQQNIFNRNSVKNTSSQYKGVYWCKKAKKWYAQIGINKKAIYLGSFDDETKAALAYNEKAKEIHGEFARLNEVGGELWKV